MESKRLNIRPLEGLGATIVMYGDESLPPTGDDCQPSCLLPNLVIE